MISALFPSADGAITALTASTCLDVLRLPEHASLRVGRPRKGYMNDGLLRGGAVAWRGYLVDVEVTRRASLFGDELRTHGYVVRLRDGEIIDVHKGVDHEFLGFVD